MTINSIALENQSSIGESENTNTNLPLPEVSSLEDTNPVKNASRSIFILIHTMFILTLMVSVALIASLIIACLVDNLFKIELKISIYSLFCAFIVLYLLTVIAMIAEHVCKSRHTKQQKEQQTKPLEYITLHDKPSTETEESLSSCATAAETGAELETALHPDAPSTEAEEGLYTGATAAEPEPEPEKVLNPNIATANEAREDGPTTSISLRILRGFGNILGIIFRDYF